MLPNRRRALLLGGIVAAVSVIGCGSGVSSAGAPASPSNLASASPTPEISPSPTPRPPLFTQVGTMDLAGMATGFPMKDGRVLMIVGDDSAEGEPGTVLSAFVFDPATGRAALTATTAPGHYGAAIAQLQDGRVLVAGGRDEQNATTSAEIFDPETGSFSPTGTMQFAFELRSAITLQDGRVLIFESAEGKANAEIYDPATGKFSKTGSMTIARWGAAAIVLDDGRVLIAGGSVPEDEPGPMGLLWYDALSAETYDPATGKFSPTGSLATVKFAPAMTKLQDGRVLLMSEFGEPELYDPVEGTFSPAGAMVEPRRNCSATLLPDGRVLIVGGVATAASDGTDDSRVLESTEYYDPVGNTFSPGAPMPTARYGHSAFLMPDGSVLIIGGAGGDPGVLENEAENLSAVLQARP
jgi:hypothetical protein